jgi:ribonucleotide reductase alpha subunit
MYDWETLRQRIMATGVRNSLLIALMPTVSTSIILGNTESFEPITSNLYNRNLLGGSFQICNKYLMKDLMKLNLWNNEIRQKIILNDGSIQKVPEIPQVLKNIYKTVWEYKQVDIIDINVIQSKFVDQSMSCNRYLDDPTYAKIRTMDIICWRKGLKTGTYYLRIKNSVTPNKILDNNAECAFCSS